MASSARSIARKASTAPASHAPIEEAAHSGQRAPAPLSAQQSSPNPTQEFLFALDESSRKGVEKLVNRKTDDEGPVEQVMTLGDLERLVEKAKRGVRTVVADDRSEAADWDPGRDRVVMSGGGAALVSRML